MVGQLLVWVGICKWLILKKVKNNESIENIKDIIVENLKRYDNYIKALESEYIFWERWLKPLLLSIEYTKWGEGERDFIPIERNLQIEHILPQSWDAEKSWDGEILNWKNKFTKAEAENLLNSLGNLTLITGKKNIEASNCNFDKKQEIYKGNSGKGFDGVISFEITKEIIDEYEDWTPETISKRYKKLVNEIKEIFKIQEKLWQ